MDRPIVMLHGLGERPYSLAPLKYWLRYVGGYTNIHIPKYQVADIHYDEAFDRLDKLLEEILDKENDEPIFIGQSMGGVMANNLHKRGWKIFKSITIGSPLHGARYLNLLDSILPTRVRNYLYQDSYEYLMKKGRDEEPPHDHHAITMSLPFTSFDGCVHMDEGVLDSEKHTHISWSNHWAVFYGPRLMMIVLRLIRDTHSDEETVAIEDDKNAEAKNEEKEEKEEDEDGMVEVEIEGDDEGDDEEDDEEDIMMSVE